MKKFIILLLVCVVVMPAFSQEPDIETVPEVPEAPEAPEVSEVPTVASPEQGDTVNVVGRVEVIETPETTRVTLGKNEVIIIEENGDTVIVGLGSKGISIVEGDDGVEINVLDMDEKRKSYHKKRKKRFNGHWAGIGIGLNNYVTPDFSLTLPPEDLYMDLHTGKSWNWNFNIVDVGVGFGTDYVGLVSGLGFELINYHFNGQNGITKDPITGNTVEYVPVYADYITKSKLNLVYLTAPLLIEFQIPTQRKRIHISAGVLGSIKLCSKERLYYTDGGSKSKERIKSDFNLSPFRWGLTARVGYSAVGIFANYYVTTLFKPGMGPELHPFSAGLQFSW